MTFVGPFGDMDRSSENISAVIPCDTETEMIKNEVGLDVTTHESMLVGLRCYDV